MVISRAGGGYGPPAAAMAGTTGLVFPSNGGAPSGVKVAFKFTGAALPDITPITLIWRVWIVQHAGYSTTFFHSTGDGTFDADDTYFGCHPYPDPPPSGNNHKWEISAGGGDEITDVNGNNTTVEFGRWFTQAAVNRPGPSSNTTTDFYWDLSTSANRLITRTTQPNFALFNSPNSPHLMFGDNLWADERLSGRLRGMQIYSDALSLAQIQARMDLASDAAVVAANPSSLFYCNLNPTPDDISDKSGSGHNPSWHDSGNKATLWTE